MAPRTPKGPDEKPAADAKPAVKGKSAAGKPAKPALKVVEKSVTISPGPVAAPAAGAPVKLRQLVEEVATATGLKKPEARKAVEATLAALGAALAAKSTLAVPPLGKLRVAKASAGVLTLKLRLADAAFGRGLALAEDGEDD